MPPARGASRLVKLALLAALSGTLLAQLLAGLWRDALTVDEGIYVAAGFQHLAWRDFRPNPETPPLAKLIAAAPLLGLGLRVPARPTGQSDAEWATLFLLRANDTGRLLASSRLPTVLVALLVALGLGAWARAVAGPLAGWTALALAAFHPALAGHGHLATTDVPGLAGVLAASAALAGWARRPGPGRAAAVGLAFGLAVCTRLTAVLLLPAWALWLAARWRRDAGARPRTSALLGLGLAVVLGAASVAWAAYGFRRAAGPDGAPLARTASAPLGLPGRLLDTLDGLRLLPEGYVEAWRFQLEHVRRGHPAFFLGQHGRRGWATYYLVTLAVKNTPGFLLALLALAWSLARRRPAPGSPEALWLLSAAAFFLAHSLGAVQLGDRYLLPVYGFLVLLVAGRAPALLARPAGRAAGAALLALHALPALAALPSGQVAYFNALAGGTTGAHRLLLDSNLDWGQDLGRVGEWMRAHDVAEVRLGYVGPDDPERFGIRHQDLPGRHGCVAPRPAGPSGVVVVSPNVLFNLAGRQPDPYAELASRPPDDRAGVFFVFRLDRGAGEASLVPEAGLEPARVSPHAPQTCVSASSTTPAPGGTRKGNSRPRARGCQRKPQARRVPAHLKSAGILR